MLLMLCLFGLIVLLALIVRDLLAALNASHRARSARYTLRNPPHVKALSIPAHLAWYVVAYGIWPLLTLLGVDVKARLTAAVLRFAKAKGDEHLQLMRQLEVDATTDNSGYLNDLVWICTHGKAGTNMTMALTALILCKGDAQWLFGFKTEKCEGEALYHIHDRIPWPDQPGPHYTVPIEDDCITRINGRKVVKTHMTVAETAKTPNAKYISVTRDPKAVFVSATHFLRAIALGVMGPPPSVIKDVLLDERLIGTNFDWATRAKSDYEQRNNPNHLMLFYEDIVGNKRKAILQIAAFLEVDLTTSEIDKIEKYSDFKWGKAHPEIFNGGAATPMAGDGTMLRSGKASGGKDGLTQQERDQIDRVMKKRWPQYAKQYM